MQSETSKRYPVSRAIVYSLVGVILFWVFFSMAFSIGYSVFWERERKSAIPSESFVPLQTLQQVQECRWGVQRFHSDLMFNVQRFAKRYRQEPLSSMETWTRWEKKWREDFKEFGKRYGLMKARTDNKRQQKLSKIYLELKQLQEGYSYEFQRLLTLFNQDQKLLNESLEQLEREFRN